MRLRPLHAGFFGAFLAVLLVLGAGAKPNLPPIIVDIPDDATAQNDDFGTGGLLSDIVAESSSGLGVFVDGMRIKDERVNYDHAGTASGDAGVSLRDNLNSAYDFSEGGSPYLAFRTANNDEKVTVTKRLYATDGVASGTEKLVGGILCANTTASTALDGTVETPNPYDTTCEIPANTLKAGTIIKITGQGIHTATTGTEAHGYVVRLDAVDIGTTATSFDPANNDRFVIHYRGIVRAVGASGTLLGEGDASIISAGAGAALAPKGMTTGSGATSTTTIDTTTALTVSLVLDYNGVTTDGSSSRLDYLYVEVY